MTYGNWERSINFAAVRAAVESGLAWLQVDPMRGMRNLLDLGGYFARTRRQRDFFQTARRLLGSRRCPYMRLVERALAGVDMEVLKTVGINLGYFSWSLGVRAIRDIISARGIRVPWSPVFRLDGARADALSPREVQRALEQARALGAHSFWFRLSGGRDYIEAIVALFGRFRDCAFMLMPEGEAVTRELAQLTRAQRNTLVCVDRADIRATAALREARLMYGLSLEYDDTNAFEALDGELLSAVERADGHFALLLRGARCSEGCRRAMQGYVARERLAPTHAVFTVDMYGDMEYIDQVIAARECYVEIGPDGAVYDRPWADESALNLRDCTLAQALAAIAAKRA